MLFFSGYVKQLKVLILTKTAVLVLIEAAIEKKFVNV